MSDKIGPLTFGKGEEQPFLGREFSTSKPYSEATAKEIDEEIKRIVQTCYGRAQSLIKNNLDALHRIARALLRYEVVNGRQLDDLIAGRPIVPGPIKKRNVQQQAVVEEVAPESLVKKKKPVPA